MESFNSDFVSVEADLTVSTVTLDLALAVSGVSRGRFSFKFQQVFGLWQYQSTDWTVSTGTVFGLWQWQKIEEETVFLPFYSLPVPLLQLTGHLSSRGHSVGLAFHLLHDRTIRLLLDPFKVRHLSCCSCIDLHSCGLPQGCWVQLNTTVLIETFAMRYLSGSVAQWVASCLIFYEFFLQGQIQLQNDTMTRSTQSLLAISYESCTHSSKPRNLATGTGTSTSTCRPRYSSSCLLLRRREKGRKSTLCIGCE
jgi:hypothetical protein